jgi:chemotaxis protein CheD
VEQIVVGMADGRIAEVPGQVLATYALGSCIGLTMYDPAVQVGGLLHYMLPDSALDPARGRENPYMFADTGIARLLDQILARGGSKRRLVVGAVGAARIMDPDLVFDIGRRNHQAARKILWKAGILVHREEVGGVVSRTLRLEIGTGRVWLQDGGGTRDLVPASPQKGVNRWPTAS